MAGAGVTGADVAPFGGADVAGDDVTGATVAPVGGVVQPGIFEVSIFAGVVYGVLVWRSSYVTVPECPNGFKKALQPAYVKQFLAPIPNPSPSPVAGTMMEGYPHAPCPGPPEF